MSAHKRSLADDGSTSDSDGPAERAEPTKAARPARPARPAQPVMTCSLPPRCVRQPTTFYSLGAFEAHYRQQHEMHCHSCARVFPSERILELHITEHHDPIAEVRRERGDKIYACFVDGCDKVCADSGKRRRHLIDKHCFPREYMFGVVNHGLRRGQTSLLGTPRRGRPDDDATPAEAASPRRRRPRPPVATDDSDEGAGVPELDADFVELGERLQGVKLVPDKIRFGRKR
ncbi:zinc finger protein-like protein [Dipodascopsis tothii]|uniref:zinc finger protein-like protein n=1 Tax=Dipodascopsis tothii TaxID=44089 RepID=UPI0034CF4F71